MKKHVTFFKQAGWAFFLFFVSVSFTYGQYTLTEADVVVEKGMIQSCSYNFAVTDIIIPDTLYGKPVTGIADKQLFFSGVFYNKGITSVQLPNTLTYIGSEAFRSNQLTSVSIPNSVTAIGEKAFASNQLTNIALPDPVIKEGYTFTEWHDGSGTVVTGITDFDNSYEAQFTLTGYLVSGTVSGCKNISGLRLILSGDISGVRYANEDSTYSFALNEGRTITITPEHDYFVFNPISIVIDNISENSSNNDFVARPLHILGSNEVVVDNGIIQSCSYSFDVTDIRIPEVIYQQTVTGIADKDVEGVFYNKGITSVQLPNTLTYIGSKAFRFNRLTYVSIPDSVTTIGLSAFAENQLTGVTIGNSVDTIGDYAFAYNQLTEVTVPDNVTVIGPDAFYSNKLTNVTIGNGVATIGGSAFRDNQLTSLTIGNGVDTIGDHAFENNQLTNVSIPNSVTVIGGNAFYTNQLTSVTIGNSVATIGEVAFANNQLTSVIIPNSVTTIGVGAFLSNKLTSVTIPNSVTSIGRSAFEDNQLTSVTIGNLVDTIGGYAFYSNKLTSVTIGNSVTTIGESAFKDNQLTSVTIPGSVTSVGAVAFKDNHLTSVIIPNSVITIGAGAFNNNAINEINGKPSKGLIFARNNDGTDDSTTVVSYGGDGDMVDFIPNSVTIIGDSSFWYNQLTSVEIPNSVTTIGYRAFGNNQLTNVSLGNRVTTIGGAAFRYNQLSNVSIPNSVTVIGEFAFANNQLTSVSIPDSVTTIGYNAFYLNKLTNVTLGDRVATIGREAFANNSLESVELPDPVIKEGYTFVEWHDGDGNTVTKITNFNTDYEAQFTLTGHLVSGAITGLDDISGFKLILSGDISGVRYANDDSTYSFALNDGRTVTITPEKKGYVFEPSSIIINNITGDMPNNDFVATKVVTGVIKNEKLQVNTYPNPVRDVLTVKTAGRFTGLQVVNLAGVVLKDMECKGRETVRVDMSNLHSGIYIIKLTGEKGMAISKVIKR